MSVLRATDVQFREASLTRAGRSAGQYRLCVTSDRPRMTGELRFATLLGRTQGAEESTGNGGPVARTEPPAELAEAEAGGG